MIEFTKYKCDYCKKELKSKGAMKKHEETKCLCNPIMKSCGSCANVGKVEWLGITAGRIIKKTCCKKIKGKEIFGYGNTVIDCPKWKQK